MLKKILIIMMIVQIVTSSSFAMDISFKDLSEAMKYCSKGVIYNGQLKVKGNKIVNKYDEIIQLKGMSSHGILWYPEYTNYRSLMTTRSYGANVFRIAMYTSERDGYIGKKQESKDALYMALENALGTDMYVVIDWHILKDGNPNKHLIQSREFFSEISSRYSNNPSIIYEICNEPNGEVTWEDVKMYAHEIIPVIRKNSPEALIIVGSPKYSTDIWSVSESPLNFDNIVYSYHYYTDIGHDGYKDAIRHGLENGLPVFVTEWGMKKDQKSQEFDYEEAKKFIAYLDENKISWINWSLSNKNEEYSVIKHNEKSLSNWSPEQLTDNGKFIFKLMGQ